PSAPRGPLVNWLGAVPLRIRPEAGKVTDDKPILGSAKSVVPAHNWVVVGVFNTVTFCAFAGAANARRSVTHSKPRYKVSVRAVGCASRVLVKILIDVRLSRPEAWASGTIAMEAAAGAAVRPGIRACFLMGVLRDARLAV